MQSRELHFETGVNHDSFKIILDFIKDIRTHNNVMALGLYLSRIRRGYTFEELQNKYNFTRQTISLLLYSHSKSSTKDFEKKIFKFC